MRSKKWIALILSACMMISGTNVYRLEKCFLFLSDYESMSLRHLQDVCENLGVLNRKFLC